MTAAPTPDSVFLLTVLVTLACAGLGVLIGRSLAKAARRFEQADWLRERPSSLPAYREAMKARRGVWR